MSKVKLASVNLKRKVPADNSTMLDIDNRAAPFNEGDADIIFINEDGTEVRANWVECGLDDEQRMVELGAKLASKNKQPVTEESKEATQRLAEMAKDIASTWRKL